jgi:hypothetical protein
MDTGPAVSDRDATLRPSSGNQAAEARVAISLDRGREPKAEPAHTAWNGVVESGLRFLPLLGAALPATLIVAYSYALGVSDYFRIPMEFIRVSPMQAVIPFAWAYLIVQILLRFAHQLQMFGPWPAIRKNLARVRGLFVLLLVAVGVAGRLRGEFSWTDVIGTAVVMYVLLWGLIPGVWLGLRWIARRLPAGRFVWRPLGKAITAIWRHIFGKTPDLRGSRVSRWSVAEVVLVVAVGLFIVVPYGMGAAHARIQAVYGLVGRAASEAGRNKDAIVAVYGDKAFVAHVEGTRMRTVEVRNFSDLRDVEVSQKEIGRLHW